jgi:hypothetical protein
LTQSVQWIDALNEQSEWRSSEQMLRWCAKILKKPGLKLSEGGLKAFSDTLTQIRHLIYAQHFEYELDLRWLNRELSRVQLCFQSPAKTPGCPPLGAIAGGKGDEKLLETLRLAILIQFAADFSQSLASETKVAAQRCEGLFRDLSANKLSTIPAVEDQIESAWRQEIPALIENELLHNAHIQRCGDLFAADSRSKFCSNACRFSTFQIVKQLNDPEYLANKQRRYRERKG